MKKAFLFLFLLLFTSFAFSDEILTVTSAYTTTADDETVLCDASGGAITITLLDCRTNTILSQIFKKIDSSGNACTLDATGSQTIDGAATLVLSGEKNATILKCDGANWRVVTGTGSSLIPGSGGAVTDGEVPDDITIDGTDNVTLESLEGSTDDTVLVNNGTDWQEKIIPDCDNGTNDKLLYDQSTNAFSCGADQGGGGGTLPVADTTSIVEGSGDATKEIRFEVDGLTTGTVRVITPPDADFTIAGQNLANIFTLQQTINTATPLQFEGATADAHETTVSVIDPTADRTFTIPNADSTAVKPSTCAGTDKVEGVDADGDLICDTDQSANAFIGAKALSSSNQTITTATWTALALGTETGGFDTNAFHDTATNNERLTIPSGQAGYYRGGMTATWQANKNTGSRWYYICKFESGEAATIANCTGVGKHNILSGGLGSDGTYGLARTVISEPVNMAEGDYIACFVFHEQGSDVLVSSGSSCSIEKVGT